jgi:hypothetical protein
VAGVAGDEDDDGNAVAQPAKRKATVNAVTPTAGADERVSPDRLPILREYIDGFNGAFASGDGLQAAELAEELTDADEKTYVWSFLDSKTRSFIKASIADAQTTQKEAA